MKDMTVDEALAIADKLRVVAADMNYVDRTVDVMGALAAEVRRMREAEADTRRNDARHNPGSYPSAAGDGSRPPEQDRGGAQVMIAVAIFGLCALGYGISAHDVWWREFATLLLVWNSLVALATAPKFRERGA